MQYDIRISRRNFIQTSASLAGIALAGTSFDLKKSTPPLAFSTLGCPDWEFEKILDFAVSKGYKGIEIRGIKREMDLPESPVFSTTENRAATISLMKDKGLRFAGLGSSANLHFPEGSEREKSLDEARRFIDLAQQINCPYIRVFPNRFPEGQEKSKTMDLIVDGLLTLGDYAKGSRVTVLMETHGDVVHSEDLELIMQRAKHRQVGLVWDIANMWTVTRESPSQVYGRLKNYIRHTHIKDGKFVNGKLQYTLLGRGEVPIDEAIQALTNGGYKGFYSFEWEKLWHPEIAEPEVAIGDFPTAIMQYFKNGFAS